MTIYIGLSYFNNLVKEQMRSFIKTIKLLNLLFIPFMLYIVFQLNKEYHYWEAFLKKDLIEKFAIILALILVIAFYYGLYLFLKFSFRKIGNFFNKPGEFIA